MSTPDQVEVRAAEEQDIANSEAAFQRVAAQLATRVPPGQLSQDRIFVDPTGRRAEVVRRVGYLVTGLCATYTIGLVLSLAGTTAASPGGFFRPPGVASAPQQVLADVKGPPDPAVAVKPVRRASAATEKDSNGTTSTSLQNAAQDDSGLARRSVPALPAALPSQRDEATRPKPGPDRTDDTAPKPAEPGPTQPPAEPDPVEPDPVEPDPVEPDPVEPGPVEPDEPSDEPPTDGGDEAPEDDGDTSPPSNGPVGEVLEPVGDLLSGLLGTE